MDPFAGPSTSTPQRGSSSGASRGSRGGGNRGKDGSSSGRGGGSKKTSSSTAQSGGDNAGRGKRGPGRPRGRGRGRGRGRIASSSLGRESLTSRRSESTTRGGTVDPRGSAARGTAAPGSPGAEEDGAGTVRVREGREDEEDEDEDPADEDEDEGLLENLGEEEMKWREEMERIRGQAMGPLIAAMSEDQYDRHECYRRAGFNRANLRRLVNTHLGGGGTGASVNPTMTMAFGGVAKVFVGEIIEGARRIQSLNPELPEGSPLSPASILESYRLYSQSHAESASSNGLARGRANAEVVNAGAALGGGMGGRRRLF
ncbi:TAFII28-domain-containing protein [Microstroma glucosiphilum]|uniref:TAFII28-domain-containing protein n=1 Tax=Pseudomicrostroma glucosiphilum TaxID=1684307 RepID=A0A316U7G6_9BASI|nr:TAFII28-domain-containing protein [Pseudomicrostroma glucosiphilum]PWN21180.1 TAFII28-domain-containing protein [Pseudomicrostroma glucosiphilum]